MTIKGKAKCRECGLVSDVELTFNHFGYTFINNQKSECPEIIQQTSSGKRISETECEYMLSAAQLKADLLRIQHK